MNSAISFFKSIDGSLISIFPNDNVQNVYDEAVKQSVCQSQILVHRNGNLMYYCYTYKVSKNGYFGICIRLNSVYIQDIGQLFKLFETNINDIAVRGRFLKLIRKNKKTYINFGNEFLYTDSKEIERLSLIVKSDLDQLKFNILPPDNLSPDKQKTFSYNMNYVCDIILSSYSNTYTLIQKDITSQNKNKNDNSKGNKGCINIFGFAILFILILFAGSFYRTDVIGCYEREIQNEDSLMSIWSSKKDSFEKSKDCTLKQVKDSLNILKTDNEKYLNTIENLRDSIYRQKLFCEKYDWKHITDCRKQSLYVIQDVKIRNDKSEYGGIIYASRSNYLTVKILYNNTYSGTVSVRHCMPNGIWNDYPLSMNKGKGSSEVYLDDGRPEQGLHRIEIWSGNWCLFSRDSYIY